MPRMRGIWWYDFQDDGWRHSYNEHNFGIVRPHLTPKPAYFALAALGELLAQAEYAGRVDTGDPEVYILKFRKRDGQETWAVWSTHEEDDWQITLRTGRTNPPPVAVQRAGNVGLRREWGACNWAEGSGAPALAGQIDLTVRDIPWLITGELAGVSVAGVRPREFPEGSRGSQFLR